MQECTYGNKNELSIFAGIENQSRLELITTEYREKELRDSFAINHDGDARPRDTRALRLVYHRILLLTEASGTLLVDDQPFTLSGSQLFLIARGQILQFSSDAHYSGYTLVFGDCFWDRTPSSANNCKAVLFNNAAANQHIPLTGEDLAELLPLFEAFRHEYARPVYINQVDALAAYLKIVMIQLANLHAALFDAYDDHDRQLYRNFLYLLSKQYDQTHAVAEFARQLGVTARKLTAVCVHASGQGAKDIINGQLIAEAKRTLQFSTTPIKEIAWHLAFSTPEQFSHFFKQRTRVSPEEYRSRFVKIGM